MLTDEKIDNMIMDLFCKVGPYIESTIVMHEPAIKDFARKLLSEVRLEDMLKLEEKFIERNIDNAAYIDFDSYHIVIKDSMRRVVDCIKWEDYPQWKQTIEGDRGESV